MRRLIWLLLILWVITGVAGCARTKRIANDIDWVIFDGQPSRDN